MKKQTFEYQWERPHEGSRYINERDLRHAICNSNKISYDSGIKPKTPDEKAVHEALEAVLSAIEAVPRYGLRYERLVVPEEADKKLVSVYKDMITDLCMMPLGVSNFIDDMARYIPVLERDGNEMSPSILERMRL